MSTVSSSILSESALLHVANFLLLVPQLQTMMGGRRAVKGPIAWWSGVWMASWLCETFGPMIMDTTADPPFQPDPVASGIVVLQVGCTREIQL